MLVLTIGSEKIYFFDLDDVNQQVSIGDKVRFGQLLKRGGYLNGMNLTLASSADLPPPEPEMSGSQVIVEVDLGIHPYQGIIGCWQEMWSSWLEPKIIHYFTRDSPIAYNIYPGDVILCEQSSIYDCDSGKVILPVKKFATAEELGAFLRDNPKIKILAWDVGINQTSLIVLARNFFHFQQNIETGQKLSPEEFSKLLALLNELTEIKRDGFVFPTPKIQLLDQIIVGINSAFIEKVIGLLNAQSLIEVPPVKLLSLIAPALKLAAPSYSPDSSVSGNLASTFSQKSNETPMQKLQAVFMKDFEDWFARNGTHGIDVKSLSGEYTELKRKILQAQVREVEQSPVLVKGASNKQYDISELRKTAIGGKLLVSMKISERKSWVDNATFALIEASLKHLNISVKLQTCENSPNNKE